MIKKRADEKIDNPIGDIFRTWNIMEYKSPTDYVSIDDFYKVCAYACLLKSDGDAVNEIKFQDITISFVCSQPPRKVFEHLKQEREYEISDFVNGIYYVLRKGDMPIQFIILDELNVEHKWLVALTDQITKEMLHNLVQDYREEEKNEYKEVILDTVLRANYDFVRKLKEEEDMSKEILELFRPEIEEIEKKAEETGERKTQKKITVKLYQMNLAISEIEEVTGLTEAEIRRIICNEKQLV